jgi:hypothetical protein
LLGGSVATGNVSISIPDLPTSPGGYGLLVARPSMSDANRNQYGRIYRRV